MKKVFLCAAILFLVFAAAAFADRAGIEEALNSYEAVVVEAEKMAEKELLFESGDFSVIDEKAKAAETAIAAVANAKEWTIQDARRSMELRVRFNQAMSAAIQKILKY